MNPLWLSRDPIEEAGGLNLMANCGNDSLNLLDSDGKKVVNPLDIAEAVAKFTTAFLAKW